MHCMDSPCNSHRLIDRVQKIEYVQEMVSSSIESTSYFNCVESRSGSEVDAGDQFAINAYKNILSCRLFSRLHIGYEYGLSYNGLLRRTSLWQRRIFWPRWPRTFLPGRMGGSLVLGLTAISVLGFYPKLL